MKNIKRLAAAAATGVLALALGACGSGEGIKSVDSGASDSGKTAQASEKKGEKVLRLAFNQPIDHPEAQAALAMSDKIYDATNGKISIDVYPNESLGAQQEVVQLVQDGTVDMAYFGGPQLENLDDTFAIFNMPFIFSSPEQQVKATNDPEIVGDLYKSMEDNKLKVLAAYHAGVRNMYLSDHPVNGPEDLAGVKIRVQESDTHIKMVNEMGGIGTPMGQGEVYTAIQSKVLGGGENNEIVFSSLKHAEIAPYYSYTRHLMVPDYLVINTGLWDSFDADTKAAFEKAVTESIDDEFQRWNEATEKAIADAKAAGAKFNEVDPEVFGPKLKKFSEKLLNEKTRPIWDAVQKVTP